MPEPFCGARTCRQEAGDGATNQAGRAWMPEPAVTQCQRFSHPRRQKKTTMPTVVASMIPTATTLP